MNSLDRKAKMGKLKASDLGGLQRRAGESKAGGCYQGPSEQGLTWAQETALSHRALF